MPKKYTKQKNSSEINEMSNNSLEDTDLGKKPKSRSLLSSLFLSIITYFFFFGLSYVLSRYISIPQGISFVLYAIFGGLAVLIKVEPNKLKRLKHVPLLRRHFGWMYKININIRKTFESGTGKGAFRFALSMIYLIIYFGWLNLLLNTIKYFLSFVIDMQNPFQWLEAFFCLLGAGIIAFLKWEILLFHHQKSAKKALQAEGKYRKIRFFGRELSFGFALYILLLSYFFWVVGLTLFLLTGTLTLQLLPHFMLGSGLFFILLLIILIINNFRVILYNQD